MKAESAVLFVDPASTRTGWALMTGADRLVGWGVVDAPKAWDAHKRVDKITDDLRALVRRLAAEHGFSGTVVMETTSGHVGAQVAARGGSKGLAFYGMAIGAIRQMLRGQSVVGSIEMVRENVWTKGGGKRSRSKQRRAADVAYRFPGNYDPSEDKGLDAADAIGLGAWWFSAKGIR